MYQTLLAYRHLLLRNNYQGAQLILNRQIDSPEFASFQSYPSHKRPRLVAHIH